MPPAPLLLVLDGNSLLHRAYHAASLEGFTDRSGRPVWALRGLFNYVARAAAHLRPQAVVVGFDCPDHSARRLDYPAYKGHRPEKAADLVEQLAGAPELLRAAGICTVVPTAFEADDVLASSAEHARRSGWRSVLMTSDRDAFALIDDTTSVLRIRNGGFDEAVMVDAASLLAICGVQPRQYRDYAALRGDPSDNLHGVRRFGAATAARLLQAFDTVEAAWAALDRGDEQSVRDVVGELAAEELGKPAMRAIVERNRRIMSMRDDLPVPELDTVRLPLNRMVMRQALSDRGINLGPSLWALTGGLPPQRAEEPVVELRPWTFRRGMASRRDPTPGQLALF
ncbi:DNA polymerase-1 [Allocatelliglobosispora scoriae]|uniref:5'-3' exonuclease n=1 Tax=Allocatelliglobosispora scoriae TaxID=643052 RepID=A0A841C606_9ACTN|nr:5'-3' exonuclease H3TH domain-containing protein [Allocatelliglobosispora scoriae]MBB5874512.1 DNA polymerase-1 [Allocatelliglobosispora scoriae]